MRQKYDYLSLIEFNNLIEDFEIYKNKHPKISLRRAARAFVIRNQLTQWSIFRKDIHNKLVEEWNSNHPNDLMETM